MLAVYAMAVKDLRVLLRDLGGLVTLFAMPLVFIVVMSFALSKAFTAGTGDNPIRVPVVLTGAGEVAELIAADMAAVGGLAIVRTDSAGLALTRAAAEAGVERGDFALALVFPSGFTDALTDPGVLRGAPRGLPLRVEVIVDPATSPQVTGPIEGAVSGLIQNRVAETLAAAQMDEFLTRFAPDASPEVRAAARRALAAGTSPSAAVVELQRASPPNVKAREKMPDTYQQNVPGYTVMGVLFIITVMADSVIRERMSGTLRRLRAAPVRRWSIIAGKLVPYFLVNIVQVAIMFAVARLAFGMDLMNPAAIALIGASLALAASGLGILVAALTRTQAQAGGLGALLVLTTSALGGAFVPSFAMPEAMRTLGKITPQSWAIQGFQDVLVRGQGVPDVLMETGLLALFGVLFIAVGAWRFRFE